jgi:hypothetical protein
MTLIKWTCFLATFLGSCRSSRQQKQVIPQDELIEAVYNENAGEGDLAISLRISRDSTFYNYNNLGKSRGWSGRTDGAYWSQLATTLSDSILLQAGRIPADPGYDGHSASVYVRRQDGTWQLSLDLLHQNPRQERLNTVLSLFRHETARLYRHSTTVEPIKHN